MAEELPRECGAYTLLQGIGAGGMAVVYRAKHTKLGREVAIKMIRREVQHDPKVLELMQSEVRALAQIRNPHVVEIIDVFDSDSGEKCVVMELVAAPTLRRTLNHNTPLIFPDVMEIATQMATGIGAAHLAGVVHRDLKPDNIAIEERQGSDEQRWHVKVLDFGVAKLTRDTQGQVEHIVGTLAYLAPEVLKGEPADARADIYGFGIVLFEMLTGRPPTDPASAFELVKPRSGGFGDALRQIRQDLPRQCIELVDACTAYDEKKRPPSMQHVIAALQQTTARNAAVVHSDWADADPKPMRALVSYAALGFILLVGLVLWRVTAPAVEAPPASPLPTYEAPAEQEATSPPRLFKKKKKSKARAPRTKTPPSHVEQNMDESEPLDDPNAEDIDDVGEHK